MDFLLSNPANSRLHSQAFLELLQQYPTMMETIDNVIDVGCGEGFASCWWANVDDGDEEKPTPLEIDVTAIDKENSFKEKYEHENIKFVQSNVFDYEPEHTFDVVWAHSVLQQTTNPLKFLHKMNNFCNMGGMMCLTMPTTVNTFYGEPDYRVYSDAPNSITLVDLIHMLVLSGFNCNEGYFVKQPNTNIINALVYKDSDKLYEYGEQTLYEYTDLLPESCKTQLNRFGYLTNKSLQLYWIDGTLIDYSK